MPAATDPELVDAYQRDGAVVLRGLLTNEEVRRLRAGVDAVVASPTSGAVSSGAPGAPGTFFEDFCTWQQRSDFERVIRDSRLAATAGAHYSSAIETHKLTRNGVSVQILTR